MEVVLDGEELELATGEPRAVAALGAGVADAEAGVASRGFQSRSSALLAGDERRAGQGVRGAVGEPADILADAPGRIGVGGVIEPVAGARAGVPGDGHQVLTGVQTPRHEEVTEVGHGDVLHARAEVGDRRDGRPGDIVIKDGVGVVVRGQVEVTNTQVGQQMVEAVRSAVLVDCGAGVAAVADEAGVAVKVGVHTLAAGRHWNADRPADRDIGDGDVDLDSGVRGVGASGLVSEVAADSGRERPGRGRAGVGQEEDRADRPLGAWVRGLDIHGPVLERAVGGILGGELLIALGADRPVGRAPVEELLHAVHGTDGAVLDRPPGVGGEAGQADIVRAGRELLRGSRSGAGAEGAVVVGVDEVVGGGGVDADGVLEERRAGDIDDERLSVRRALDPDRGAARREDQESILAVLHG